MDTHTLLSILPVKQVMGTIPSTVTDIAVDSRAVNAGGVFVCIEGFTVDGHNYVGKAVDNGARVIIATKPVDVELDRVAVVLVENTSRAISVIGAPLLQLSLQTDDDDWGDRDQWQDKRQRHHSCDSPPGGRGVCGLGDNRF